MTKVIVTAISKSLYDAIRDEKRKLMLRENKKVKSRRKKITMVSASLSISRKLRK